jgi:hypothetical protein
VKGLSSDVSEQPASDVLTFFDKNLEERASTEKVPT